MNIAIIGTGNVGSALGASLGKAGHHVTFAARSADDTAKAAKATGGSAAASPRRCSGRRRHRDPRRAVCRGGARSRHGHRARYQGQIVIDATNPLKADYSGLATEGGPSGAENIASWLPGARVVKAFNTIFASVQADPSTLGVKIDALYATDDDQACVVVSELLSSIGFHPVYVGQLARARELEAIANLNIHLQMETNGDWRTSINFVGAPAASTTLSK